MCHKATTYVRTALHNRQWQMSPTAQTVLFAIADAHFSGKNYAITYLDELISHHMTRPMSKSTLLRALAELKNLGIIEHRTRVHVARGRYPGSRFTIFGYDPGVHIARFGREELGLSPGHLRPPKDQEEESRGVMVTPQTGARSARNDTSGMVLEVSEMTPRDAREVPPMTPRPIPVKANCFKETKLTLTANREIPDQNLDPKNASKITRGKERISSDPAGPSTGVAAAPSEVGDDLDEQPFRLFGVTRRPGTPMAQTKTTGEVPGSPQPVTPSLLAPRRATYTPLPPLPRGVTPAQRAPAAVIAAWKETHNGWIDKKIIIGLADLCHRYTPALVIQADQVMPEITTNLKGYSLVGLESVCAEMHDKKITTADTFLRQRALHRGTAVVMTRVDAATLDPAGERKRRIAWHIETFGTRPYWDDEDEATERLLDGNQYGDEQEESVWQ